MRRSFRARMAGVAGTVVLAVGMTVAFSGVAAADSASDPTRATFVAQEGPTVTTCEDVDLGSDTLVGAQGNTPASDSNVQGVVTTNAGPIHTGQGEELNVTILGSNVVIDAVVVKAGDGYNLYEDEDVLPPTLRAPQHYIAPFNNGDQLPAISHWFVCYHLAEGPTTGSLVISKTVVAPDGVTVPASFSVHVSCESGEFDKTIAVGSPATITGLPDGDVCVVEETNVPSGATVTYTPATANTVGVEIVAGETPVTVGITNTFSPAPEIQVSPAPVVVAGAVAVAADPIVAAPAFTG